MKFKLAIFLFIISLIAGWFYWFHVRTARVRKECIKFVDKKKDEPGELYVNQANVYYSACLVRHGVKPEDMIRLLD